MAKAPDKKDSKAESEAAPKAGKSKLIIIIAILALVLIGGGVGAWMFLKPKPAAEGGKDAGGEEEKKKEAEKPPVFQELEQFTVNLKDQGVHLQVSISLKVKDEKMQEEVKAHMPEIKDIIINLLSSKASGEISDVASQQKLKDDIQVAVNRILGAKKPEDGVSKVLFTQFIIE